MNICIISHNAFGAISGDTTGKKHIGGVENQTTLMARWLAQKGHEVSLITWDEGQEDGVRFDGVTVYKMCRPDSGLPGIRFFTPRLSSLYGALSRAAADVYYYNAAEAVTGLIAAWCRWKGKPFVYSSAQELDCHRDLPHFKNGDLHRPMDAVLYKYGLRKSTKIIVQTERQRQLLLDGFGLASVALPMPCRGPEKLNPDIKKSWEGRTVVWVARVAPVKRLEWLIDLAPLVPEAKFEIVGANADTPYGKELFERAKKVSNIIWRGAVPIHQMASVYDRAACLCSTSIHEGFPNTFLESWSHGKPVISSFDPDGLIERMELGMVAKDLQGLASALRLILTDSIEWRRLGDNGRRYFEENHRIDAAMGAFERELAAVLPARSVLARSETAFRNAL